jgi:hypothetical protein
MTDPIKDVREAFLNLWANAKTEFVYDGDADDEGRTIVTCDVVINTDPHDLRELCDALGMTGPITEHIEERIQRYVEMEDD